MGEFRPGQSNSVKPATEMPRTNEIDPVRLRPHPYEFELCYDI